MTDVLQFGLPESKDQYIHRIGRTGRAGKQGQGLIVLSPFESKFISDLRGLDVHVNQEMHSLLPDPVDMILYLTYSTYNSVRASTNRS